jgi:hypothetical protein
MPFKDGTCSLSVRLLLPPGTPSLLLEKSAIEWQHAQLRHWEHAHGYKLQLRIRWVNCAMNLGLVVAAVPIRALLLREREEVDVDSICHSFL